MTKTIAPHISDTMTVNLALSYNVEQQYIAAKMLAFLDGFGGGGLYSSNYAAIINSPREAMLNRLLQNLPEVRFFDLNSIIYLIGEKILLTVQFPSFFDPRAPGATSVGRSVSFTLCGEHDIVRDFERKLIEMYGAKSPVPILEWELLIADRHQSHPMPIAEAQPIYREYYPWLKCDPTEYFEEFFDSDEQVLVLLGETGTGKTTFLRNMIWHLTLHARVVYHKALLERDDMYVAFLTDPNSNVLIAEDADQMLVSREAGQNEFMARFLNLSDGLIGNRKKKKFIFTANIMQMNRLDAALVRDGRCFDCMTFRSLSYDEACAAAGRIGIDRLTTKRSYTLAELFAQKRKSDRRHRVGGMPPT